MTRDEAVIQMLTLANTLMGEEVFSETWTSFMEELIEVPVVLIDKNYSEDDEEKKNDKRRSNRSIK